MPHRFFYLDSMCKIHTFYQYLKKQDHLFQKTRTCFLEKSYVIYLDDTTGRYIVTIKYEPTDSIIAERFLTICTPIT